MESIKPRDNHRTSLSNFAFLFLSPSLPPFTPCHPSLSLLLSELTSPPPFSLLISSPFCLIIFSFFLPSILNDILNTLHCLLTVCVHMLVCVYVCVCVCVCVCMCVHQGICRPSSQLMNVPALSRSSMPISWITLFAPILGSTAPDIHLIWYDIMWCNAMWYGYDVHDMTVGNNLLTLL